MRTKSILKRVTAYFLMTMLFALSGMGRTPLLAEAEESVPMKANYSIYTNDHLWGPVVTDNTSCQAAPGMFLSALNASLTGQPEGMPGTISYQVNLSGSGWLDWVENGVQTGTTESDTPIEAIRMKLTGQLPENYELYYTVLQNGAWTAWAANGETAGIEAQGYVIQGLRVTVAQKGTAAPEIKAEDPVVQVPEPEPVPVPEEPVVMTGPIDPNRPMIALTFDDGPNAHVTNRILDSLEQSGARATFFMVGNRIHGTANTAVVARMAALSCELGNHTFEHKGITKLSAAEIQTQLNQANQAVAAASGVTPILMRPPGGAKDSASMEAVGSVEMRAVLWSLDTMDWKTRDKQQTVDAVLNQIKDGDIVLMHDLYETTADAVEVMVPELIKRGYQLVTVSELASSRGGMGAGKSYSQFRP